MCSAYTKTTCKASSVVTRPVKHWLCALQLGCNVALACFINFSPQFLEAQAVANYSNIGHRTASVCKSGL